MGKKTGPKGPSKFTPECIKKLEQAFAIGCTVTEACIYVDITNACFYQHAPTGSDLFEHFMRLREKPILKARQTVVKNLNDVDVAFKYLERKRKKEFSVREERTGANGQDLFASLTDLYRDVKAGVGEPIDKQTKK